MNEIITIIIIIAVLVGYSRFSNDNDSKDSSEGDWNVDDFLPDEETDIPDSDSDSDSTGDIVDDYQNELLDLNGIKMLSTREVLARTLYGEGRGLPDDEVYHIGEVILNRKNVYKFPNTIKEVCLQEIQFSCWNSLYRNVLKTNHRVVRKREISTERYNQLLDIAENIIRNSFTRDLGFETYFYFIPESTDIIENGIIVESNARWKEGLKLVHKDSKHYFFREWL